MGESKDFIELTLLIGLLLFFGILFYILSRLTSIKETFAAFLELEQRKPENRINLTCGKCKEIFSVSALKNGELVDCPKCKEPNRVSE
jgi:uncharacterized paraquat-inducible protein A